LMAQVAGRAGRRQKRGEVILQTSHPEHLIIQAVLKNDYLTMYEAQMEERKLFRYPPLYRIIEITLKHKSEKLVEDAALALTLDLKTILEDRVLGPDKPVIGKIQMQHLRRILLKIETSASLPAIRKILEEKKSYLLKKPDFKYIVIQYDVDPV